MSIGQLSRAFGLDVSTLNRHTAALLREGLAGRTPPRPPLAGLRQGRGRLLLTQREVAGHLVRPALKGRLGGAHVLRERAAGAETAAGRRVERARQLALDRGVRAGHVIGVR
ncbi:hypothetical protein AB0K12_46450 [Nonomuraea sp. NPDC049419]|uniref:hypothetical protein n=1 Tax=Nonomuraea sp. NPDC049419 TaxID=3155772 RepID=UPI0034355F7A